MASVRHGRPPLRRYVCRSATGACQQPPGPGRARWPCGPAGP
ncbi:hypothetical protein Rumeso_04171 [Rubellimicrobium mesophilum DSM 19309]|uniref:Uncharacterized protein n=1 Tax=Rubellimicrobium mesophilum DSM 19309 TaxID=442562 RepID=A0A017HIG1_9RHOB|nr:hypothetical protein Rumeso_04171 [Rubellimicrobium mesophilum DSM 19309]